MRNDKDVEKYKKLENNFIKKNKEMTQLKQDNNMLLFQIEDLNRKYKDKNHNINSNSLKIKLKKQWAIVIVYLQIKRQSRMN